jgi:hypothetical protein
MQVVTDYAGRRVRLTDERRRHILDRPEMAGMNDAIVETLQAPEAVVASRTDPAVALAYRHYSATPVGDKWLCVVVKYQGEDAFVITAYLTDTVKKGERLWPVP